MKNWLLRKTDMKTWLKSISAKCRTDTNQGSTPKGFVGRIFHLFQSAIPFLRDDHYHNYTIMRTIRNLVVKIQKETPWLSTSSLAASLSFNEQAINYYKYKNMVIQRRAQFVIIFLTIALLTVTCWEIYLKFF